MKDDSTTMGMLAHLLSLLSWFIGPLVIYLIKKDEDRFVAEHAKEALNFNITMTLIYVMGIFLGLITIGFGFIIVIPVLIVFGVLDLIWTITAAVRANDGQAYRYPVSIRFIS